MNMLNDVDDSITSVYIRPHIEYYQDNIRQLCVLAKIMFAVVKCFYHEQIKVRL